VLAKTQWLILPKAKITTASAFGQSLDSKTNSAFMHHGRKNACVCSQAASFVTAFTDVSFVCDQEGADIDVSHKSLTAGYFVSYCMRA
jgi:hypothetical protein